MHIKEVIIDGFKSYAVRTSVGKFDEHFNAITGKNGTGKSNILDALCFVLGITQLSKVRVHSLAELVYKQGQTGVTRASVILILDNLDKARSPLSYEACDEITVEREVVIGGRNKYRINGKNVSHQLVAQLFHSVQLNVNNAHFLIMQGTITRVINMKPAEIAALLEEAAGTKMYENKKLEALRTLEKKHLKIKEIDQVMANELEPNIEKLRKERLEFQKWNESNTELLRLERFCTAVEYFKAVEVAKAENLTEIQVAIEKVSDNKKAFIEDIRTKEQRLDYLKDKKALSANVAAGRQNVKAATEEVTNVEMRRTGHERDRTQIVKRISEHSEAFKVLQKELEKKTEEVEKNDTEIGAAKDKADAITAALKNMEQRLGAQEDPMLKIRLDELQSQVRKLKDKRENLRRTLEKRKREVERMEREARDSEEKDARTKARLAEAESQLKEVEERISVISYDRDLHDALRLKSAGLNDSKRDLEDRIFDLQEKVENKLKFRYRENTSIVSRASIAGTVGSLCHVEPQHASWLTALDVILGHKIFHVVVDNKQTAATLMSQNMLLQKTSFFPVKSLHFQRMSDAQVTKAKEIAQAQGVSVSLAVDLVSFHSDVKPVFELIFGNVLVCETKAVAREVCRAAKVRCVTAEGDQFDPNGTSSGGYVPRYDASLANVSRLISMQRDLKKINAEAVEIAGKLSVIHREFVQHTENKDRREKLCREINSLRFALSDEPAGAEISVEALKADLESRQGELRELDVDLSRMEGEVEKLKIEKDNSSVLTTEAQRVKKIAELNTALAAAKYAAEEGDRKSRNLRNRVVALEERITRRRDELEASERELLEVNAKLEEYNIELQIKRSALADLRREQDAKEKEENDKNTEIDTLIQTLDKLRNAKVDLDSKHDQLVGKLESLKKDAAAAKAVAAKLMKDHVWLDNSTIVADLAKLARGRQALDLEGASGNSTAARRLTAVTENELAKRRTELENAKDETAQAGARINKQALAQCERAESEMKELTTKREALETDLRAIEELINDLDQQKGKALVNTWQIVNAHFGSIFRALLPNVDARLEPAAGLTAQEGLELKVAFGGKWKESLSELSGGQKSLLALSLILALLKYKPAPFYILDEVDAALDVSHTNNIGHMIKTVFPDSQFVIVSLKEGMFQNANVLFSTRFQDGTSMVTRSTAFTPRSSVVAVDAENEESRDDHNRSKRARVDLPE